MTRYQDAIADVRVRLDEAGVARYWQDTSLLAWLVEGCTDVARRTETLIQYAPPPFSINPGQPEYVLPFDCLRVNRIEYIQNLSAVPIQVYALTLATPYEMDQRWGSLQYQQSVYPTYAVILGTPGGANFVGMNMPPMKFQPFPVPSAAGGGFRVTYYALPNQAPALTDTLAVSMGWENLPKLYCEAIALRADRDPRWQEAKQLYEQDLVSMMEMTRKPHDQAGAMSWAGVGGSGYGGGFTYDGLLGGF